MRDSRVSRHRGAPGSRRRQQRGTPARTYPSAEALLPQLLNDLKKGDVALIMSNGSFGGIHDKLLAALAEREGG